MNKDKRNGLIAAIIISIIVTFPISFALKYFYKSEEYKTILKQQKQIEVLKGALEHSIKNKECPKHFFGDFLKRSEKEGKKTIFYDDEYICGRCGKMINEEELMILFKKTSYSFGVFP